MPHITFKMKKCLVLGTYGKRNKNGISDCQLSLKHDILSDMVLEKLI
jgi:hypothetical protein